MNAQNYKLAEEEELTQKEEEKKEGGQWTLSEMGLPHRSAESVGKREDRVGKGMNRREKSEENITKRTEKRLFCGKLINEIGVNLKGIYLPYPS